MESKLKKAKRLTNAIKGIKGTGVFTLLNNQWYHLGKAVSHNEKEVLAKQFERVIEISPKIIGSNPTNKQSN